MDVTDCEWLAHPIVNGKTCPCGQREASPVAELTAEAQRLDLYRVYDEVYIESRKRRGR